MPITSVGRFNVRNKSLTLRIEKKLDDDLRTTYRNRLKNETNEFHYLLPNTTATVSFLTVILTMICLRREGVLNFFNAVGEAW